MSKPIILGIGPEIMLRERLTERVEPWEDGLRADTGPGSFEWWYFDAHFSDGATAVIIFFTKSPMELNGPLKPSVQITITRPDGKKLTRYVQVSPEQFSSATEHCDVRIGNNRVSGDLHTYELHVQIDDLAAVLTLRGQVPPWRPGAGMNYYGEAMKSYYAWLPAIPHGSVTGTLTYDGREHAVSGTGYHDHDWGNIGLNEIFSHWYWGRAQVGEYTLIFVEMNSAPAYGRLKLPVFFLARGEQILVEDGRPLKLELSEWVKHPSGHSYPRQLDFHWQGAEGVVHLRLHQPKVIEAASLLVSLPRWKQWLLRLVANPYYFRFNVDLELAIDLPAKALQGINLQGKALYEIMMLR